jgi:hypothetical protein
MQAATTDLKIISGIFAKEDSLNWFCRGKAKNGFVFLKFGSDADRAACEREWGRLPETHVVERHGATQYWLFRRRKNDPVFVLQRPILDGAVAIVTSWSQLPGNTSRHGGTWQWRQGCAPGEVASMAYLPNGWQASLPRSIREYPKLVITPRYEFEPHEARGWNGYHDLDEL